MAAPPRSRMGIASTCYMTVWRPKDSIEFLEHCDALGAGGVQTFLSSLDPEYCHKFRGRAEQASMYVEAMVPLPEGRYRGIREVHRRGARAPAPTGYARERSADAAMRRSPL